MRDELVRRARALHARCRVPYAEVGDWRVQPRIVTPEESEYLDKYQGVDYTAPGEYSQLSYVRHENVMSDIDSELVQHVPFIERARGRVLITGLGLGLLPSALLAYGQVEHIDIVELQPEVVQLVYPTIANPRITVHLGDAHTWDAGDRVWDFAWHDLLYLGDLTPEMSWEILKGRFKAGEHHQWNAELLGLK